MTTPDDTIAVQEYIQAMLPWAHGHQIKGLTNYVLAILDRPTGNQAALVRGMGNQEAALKRLTRLNHNERLAPRKLADSVLAQAITQLPPQGKVRLAMDWTIEGQQYLLTISLVIRGRAVPIYWRAYTEQALKGRMRIYEVAMFKRVLTRIGRHIRLSRLCVTADRGFADVELMDLLDAYGIFYVLRVRASTKVFVHREWQSLKALRFTTNSRRRNVGHMRYCESNPHAVWGSLSRAKTKMVSGKCGISFPIGLPARHRWRTNMPGVLAVSKPSATSSGSSVLLRHVLRKLKPGRVSLPCL